MCSVASKSYSAGDVVFECNPIIHCIKNEYKGKYCDNCLKKSNSLKKCSKCRQMYYCDKSCQQNDWKYHKNECKVFRRDNFDMSCLSITRRLLVRLILCVKSDPSFVTKRHQLIDGSDVSLNDLKIEVKIPYPLNAFTNEMLEVLNHLVKWGITFNKDEAFHWFSIIYLCGYLTYLVDFSQQISHIYGCVFGTQIGIGFYIQKPVLTHSCLPNCDFTTNGLKLEVRALKSIDSGQQMTRAFICLAQKKRERHKMLKFLQFPVCRCDRCRLNLDEDIDFEEFQKLLDKIDRKWESLSRLPIVRYDDFSIDWNLFIYFKAIYGENSVRMSEAMVKSFICFVFISFNSSESLIKLWYKRLEPSIRVTHGTESPIYRLFQSVYNNFT